jgi:hypothetical protein
MTNVEFKNDNRDYVVVTGADDAADAFYAAVDFLSDTEDPQSDYVVASRLADDDRADDGSYTFPVKCYDK